MTAAMHPDDAKRRASDLLEYYQVLKALHDFEPGQLVKWKRGMQNKTKPLYGEPAIVVEILADPVLSETKESGSAYYREPLDLILGFVDDDNFVLFHFDSRRFEPF